MTKPKTKQTTTRPPVRSRAWLADLEDALGEYPRIPREVWIGTDSPTDKVRWLARRCAGSDRTISRLQSEIRGLRLLVSDLSQLAWEHHASQIMRPNVCPVCSEPKWSKLLDMARSVKSANAELSESARKQPTT